MFQVLHIAASGNDEVSLGNASYSASGDSHSARPFSKVLYRLPLEYAVQAPSQCGGTA